jgi:hypothetical protein
MRRVADVDTQIIRTKLLKQLEGLFNLAISIAKGKVKQLRDEEGKEYDVMNSVLGVLSVNFCVNKSG